MHEAISFASAGLDEPAKNASFMSPAIFDSNIIWVFAFYNCSIGFKAARRGFNLRLLHFNSAMKIPKAGLVKKSIFFTLNDVLVPGVVNKGVSKRGVSKVLSFLKGLQDKGLLKIFLVAGQHKEKAMPLISEAGLNGFFMEWNIFFVDEDYINSKEE